MDVSKKYNLIDKDNLNIEHMPSILVYYDGNYYFYDGSKSSIEEMLHFINKIINPVIELTTDEDLSSFLALENEIEEKTEFF